jgi:hypothetical protein
MRRLVNVTEATLETLLFSRHAVLLTRLTPLFILVDLGEREFVGRTKLDSAMRGLRDLPLT